MLSWRNERFGNDQGLNKIRTNEQWLNKIRMNDKGLNKIRMNYLRIE